jgi:hypothetical protein
MTELWEDDIFVQMLGDMFEQALGFEPDSREQAGLVSG